MSTTKPNSIRKYFTQTATDVGQAIEGLVFAGAVLTTDISAAWVSVEPGFIIRVYVSADTYIAFSDFDQGAVAVSVTTSPAMLLKGGFFYNIMSSGSFMRASVNPTRIEIIQL